MGCVGSDAKNPSKSPHASKHALDNSLTPDRKQKIRKIIEKDNLIQLIVTLDSQRIALFAQISPSNSHWMMTHFCCRWDADNCLQFLLKNYFVSQPTKYIDYVNSMTVEGWTPLHLCAIWKAQKCFSVLHYYGGINLKAKDKNKNTPLKCAIQSRCQNIANPLIQYKQLKVSFTKVEGQKLTSGDVISQKTTDKAEMRIPKKIQIKQNAIPEQQKILMQNKNALQASINQIKQNQIQAQFQCVQQKVQGISRNQKAQMKFQQQKYQKQLQKKYQEAMKAQRLKYEAQIKQKEQQLQRMKAQLKEMEQRRIIQEKMQAQRLAQKFALEKEQKLKQMAKNQEQTVDKLKKQQIPPPIQQNKPIQQPKQSYPKGSIQQSFKAIKQQIPPQILELYKNAQNKNKYFDQKFPGKLSSLGNQSNENYQHFKDNIIWLRPSQIFGGQQFKLFDGIDPNDIQQGQLGVCYMLAAISSLAVKPANIEKLFVFSDLKLGFYVLRFYIHGVPTFFTIDDLIPCDKNSNFPIFTQPVGNQLWVILMQKCWAKAIGSYLSAQGMVPDEMMEDLSGAPGFGGWFQGQQSKLSVAEHIKILEKHSNLGHTVVITSGDRKIQGIVNGHAYTLMKVFNFKGKYILKIRNPWGNFEWQGQYSQKSPALTAQIKKLIGYTPDDDGIFFISQSQLVRAFDYYSISILMDTHIYSFIQFTSKANQDLFFKFTLKKPSYANIRISQKFNRMINDPNYQYSPAKFEIGKIDKNNKVKFIGEGDADTYYGAKSIHFTENVCEQLQAGDYFIRVNMQWVDEVNYNSGVISVYALEKVDIQPLDQKTGVQLLKSLYYSHAEAIPKQATDDGFGFYRIDTMKGQFILVAETDQAGNYQVEFELVAEEIDGVQLGFGMVQDLKIRLPVSKGKPAIGTANILSPADGGTTGSVYITMRKI